MLARVAAVVLALSLVGCGGGSPSPAEETSDPAAEPGPGAAASEDARPAWQDETDPAMRTQGCVIGTFTLDEAVWVSGLSEVLQRSDLNSVGVEVTGSVSVTLRAVGTYTVEAQGHRTTSGGDSPGGRLHWIMTFDGAESGTWTAGPSTLDLATGAGGRLAADNEVTIDGNPLPTDMLPVSGTPWSQALEVTCDDTGLVTRPADDPQAPDVAFHRVD